MPRCLPLFLAALLAPATLARNLSAQTPPAPANTSPTPAQNTLPDPTETLIHKLAGRPVAEPNLGQQYSIALDYLVPRIDGTGSKEQEEALDLLRAISSQASSPGSETHRPVLNTAIANTLERNPSPTVATRLLRILARTGDDQTLPAITPFLSHQSPLLREEARTALSSIGTPAAADILGAAISDEAPPRLTAGLIHSLGRIGRPEDAARITSFLGSQDPVLRETAAAALVAIGGTPAMEALAPLLDADDDGQAEERKSDPHIALHLLRLADLSRNKGDATLAASIYDRLREPAVPAPVRTAALEGQVACEPDKAMDLLRSLLTDDDPATQEAAVRASAQLEKESEAVAFLREVATTTTNPKTTSSILRQLEAREAREALPEIRKLASDERPGVAPEAITILGKMGEPADLDLLLSLAASGNTPAASAARRAIARLRGDGIATALKFHIDNASDNIPLRAEAVRAAGYRSHRELFAPTLPLLASADSILASAALEAVNQLARPEDIPDLTTGLRDSRSPAFPRLKLVLQKLCQTTDKPEEATTAIIASANGADPDGQSAALSLLATLGTDTAFGHVADLLGSDSPELRAAAIRSLADWSNFKAADKLLEMLRLPGYDDPEQSQILAGVARLARTPDIAPPDERLQLALTALSSAKAPNDTKKLISALATLPSTETAEALSKLLDHEEVAKEAAAAAIQIAAELPDDPEEKSRRAVLLQQALAVPGLPDSLREKAQELVRSNP